MTLSYVLNFDQLFRQRTLYTIVVVVEDADL